MDYKLRTQESIQNLDKILEDIRFKWSENEVDDFKSLLNNKLDFIYGNPFLYPVSEYLPNLRRAVLNKNSSMFYKVDNDTISIVYLHINKKDINRLILVYLIISNLFYTPDFVLITPCAN
jgi:hypothetical protein